MGERYPRGDRHRIGILQGKRRYPRGDRASLRGWCFDQPKILIFCAGADRNRNRAGPKGLSGGGLRRSPESETSRTNHFCLAAS